jgi:hypothetical protein
MTTYVSFGFDFSVIGAFSLAVTETGGGGGTDTIALTSRYIHEGSVSSTPTYAEFSVALQAALNASGSLNATYGVSLDVATRRFTITASGGGVTSIQLAGNAVAQNVLGFPNSFAGTALTRTGTKSPYYLLGVDVDGFSDWSDIYELSDDIAEDSVAHDGTSFSIAHDGAATLLDLTAPLIPRAQLYLREATATDPWTWQAAFRHARTIEPVIVYNDDLGGHVGRLRKESAVFRPRFLEADYIAYADIPLRLWHLEAL